MKTSKKIKIQMYINVLPCSENSKWENLYLQAFQPFVYTCIYTRLKKCLGKTRQNIQRYTCIDLYIKIILGR